MPKKRTTKNTTFTFRCTQSFLDGMRDLAKATDTSIAEAIEGSVMAGWRTWHEQQKKENESKTIVLHSSKMAE